VDVHRNRRTVGGWRLYGVVDRIGLRVHNDRRLPLRFVRTGGASHEQQEDADNNQKDPGPCKNNTHGKQEPNEKEEDSCNH
jgi:hypothetical protein